VAEKKPSPKSPTRSSRAPSRTGSGAARAAAGGRVDAAGLDALLERAAELPVAIYLDGADEAAKAEALDRLKESWNGRQPGAPPTVLRAAEAGVERVLDEVQGGSLFQPASFVLVLNVEEWTRSARTIAAAAGGVAGIPPGNVVVFTESAADPERKSLAPLREACPLHATLDGVPAEVLARWVARRLARAEVTAEPAAIDALLAAARGETGEALNETDKLAAWAGPGGRVSLADAQTLVRPLHGGRLDAFARALVEGRAGEAVDQLLRALETGESEGTVVFQLQTLVAGALRIRSGQWGWIRDRANAERLARARNERQLAAGLDLLYRVERAWKSGRGEPRALLVRAAIGLATPRG
jgi:DNA polymerase III delta subunit